MPKTEWINKFVWESIYFTVMESNTYINKMSPMQKNKSYTHVNKVKCLTYFRWEFEVQMTFFHQYSFLCK